MKLYVAYTLVGPGLLLVLFVTSTYSILLNFFNKNLKLQPCLKLNTSKFYPDQADHNTNEAEFEKRVDGISTKKVSMLPLLVEIEFHISSKSLPICF